MEVMKTNEIDCFDCNSGQLMYTKNQTKKPINKKYKGRKTKDKLIKNGREKLITNNVLFLEINSQGLLIDKNFLYVNHIRNVPI